MKKAIGILGGMGPEASVYMYKLLIEKAISEFGAKHNDDFPEIILHSVPVPDFISNDDQKATALKMLKQRVKALNKTDISCLSIACNTAHLLLPELQSVSRVPFVSMIDVVAQKVQIDRRKTVGILGTPSTIRSKLYQKALNRVGVAVVEPEESNYPILEKAIRGVIAGLIKKKDREDLIKLADSLKKQGAEAIVLGCTELPLVFPRSYSLPVYNSVMILATALLRRYYK